MENETVDEKGLASRVEELEKCLRRIVTISPALYDDWASGTVAYSCHYCLHCAATDRTIKHAADCPWLVGKELLAGAHAEEK